MTASPHELINPEGLPAPAGYSHAVAASPGRTVHVAGQIGATPEGIPEGIAEQFDRACGNVVAALRAAGAEPEHVVAMQIFTTDVDSYRGGSTEIGEAYRAHFGRHYPAMALIGVDALFEPEARVELVATAVIPEDDGQSSQGGERQ